MNFYLYCCFILLVLCGCNPRIWCERNYPPIIQYEKVRVDSLIFLEGATVYDTIRSRDTLLKERIIIDSTGRAQLKIMRDAYGNLIASCEARPDTITVTNERVVIKELTPQAPPPVNNEWWKTALAITIPAGVLMIIYKLLK